MNYSKSVGTEFPSLILFVVDNSSSMNGTLIKAVTKAIMAAACVNKAIYEVIAACIKGNTIRDRCYIGVIGYGSNVELLEYGKVSELAAKSETLPICTFEDPITGQVSEFPEWVKAKASGNTNMSGAFQEAQKIVSDWTSKFPDSFPPIVINVNDGQPNSVQNTSKAVEAIKQLGTSDGNVLVLNAYIEKDCTSKVNYPTAQDALPSNYAEFLFDITSELPDSLVKYGQLKGLSVKQGSKGMIMSSNGQDLVKFIDFGSSVASGAALQEEEITE